MGVSVRFPVWNSNGCGTPDLIFHQVGQKRRRYVAFRKTLNDGSNLQTRTAMQEKMGTTNSTNLTNEENFPWWSYALEDFAGFKNSCISWFRNNLTIVFAFSKQ
jgi:hypothetical protein